MDLYIQIGVIFLLLIGLAAFTESYLLPANEFVSLNTEAVTDNVTDMQDLTGVIGDYRGKSGITGSEVKSFLRKHIKRDVVIAVRTASLPNGYTFYGTREIQDAPYTKELSWEDGSQPLYDQPRGSKEFPIVGKNPTSVKEIYDLGLTYSFLHARNIYQVFLDGVVVPDNKLGLSYKQIPVVYTTPEDLKTAIEGTANDQEFLENRVNRTIELNVGNNTEGKNNTNFTYTLPQGYVYTYTKFDEEFRNEDLTHIDDPESVHYINDDSFFGSVEILRENGNVIGVVFEETGLEFPIVGMYF